MGGRKPSSSKRFFSKATREIKELKRTLDKSIKNEKPIEIASTAAKIIESSEEAIDLLTNATELFSLIISEVDESEIRSFEESKLFVVEEFDKIKKKKEIKTKHIDELIIIDSAAEIIGGKKK